MFGALQILEPWVRRPAVTQHRVLAIHPQPSLLSFRRSHRCCHSTAGMAAVILLQALAGEEPLGPFGPNTDGQCKQPALSMAIKKRAGL